VAEPLVGAPWQVEDLAGSLRVVSGTATDPDDPEEPLEICCLFDYPGALRVAHAVAALPETIEAARLAWEALRGAVTSHSRGCSTQQIAFSNECDCWLRDRRAALSALDAAFEKMRSPEDDHAA
jgi:hypothetical protein